MKIKLSEIDNSCKNSKLCFPMGKIFQCKMVSQHRVLFVVNCKNFCNEYNLKVEKCFVSLVTQNMETF